MDSQPSGAAPRIPFRRGSTPSFSPQRPSLDVPPLESLYASLVSTSQDLPESPTRSGSRPHGDTIRGRQGHEHSLNDEPDDLDDNQKSLRPKTSDAGKRIVYLLLLICSGLILRIILQRDNGIEAVLRGGKQQLESLYKETTDEEVCRFVSPIEAYHRDLKRLRRKVADRYQFDLAYPSNPNRTVRSHHHKFSNTGHLLISDSPGSPHPIPLLLSLGEKRWEELLSRQSRTLGEAVAEYERRYSRKPPKGFDKWWDKVKEFNLILPDEYDRINLDLAPFFALPKEEMKRRMEMVDNMKETFTLAVRGGKVNIRIKDPGGLKWGGTWPRAQDAVSLVSAFAKDLPNMKATFSIFDQPQIYLSWARRGSLVALGLRGEHTAHLQETDNASVKLSRSCAPDSAFRTDAEMNEGHSLIFDPLEAGDLCENPYLVPLHGLTIEPHDEYSHPRPHTQLLPLFSLAKTSINSDILITPLDQFFDSPGRDYRWEDKRSPKLAWRGSPTGISMMTQDLPWRDAHRIRLHHWANNRSMDGVDFIIPDLGQTIVPLPAKKEGDDAADDEGERMQIEMGPSLGFKHERVKRKVASTFYLDAKLSGGAIQCSEEDGTCDEMDNEINWAPRQRSDILNRHKFLLDIDGNGWSGRFRRLMSTNSLVIKVGIFTEWFQPHLIPWFMYVPAKLDFSDLYDILGFFRGTPHHPDLGFDETAKALAHNGKCFVQRMFRIEDLQAYMMRLFLEYARLAADKGEDMDFHYVAPSTYEDESNSEEVEPHHAPIDYEELGPQYNNPNWKPKDEWLEIRDHVEVGMERAEEEIESVADWQDWQEEEEAYAALNGQSE